MSVSIRTADLRARFQRELLRLAARPIEGGPSSVVRENVLLAFTLQSETAVIDEDVLDRLGTLPDGVGPAATWSTIQCRQRELWPQ